MTTEKTPVSTQTASADVLTITRFRTFVFEHGGVSIHDPRMSECGRFDVDPDHYGFSIYQTGGGCTAWRREFIYAGRPVYMLVTNADDASHDLAPLADSTRDSVALGVYDDAAEWSIVWHQERGHFDDCHPYNVHTEGDAPRDARRYVCEWFEGYGECEPQTVGVEFFSEENGFFDHDTADVLALHVGATNTIGGAACERMTVKRIA